jgi:large subunit ribosomal protein L18
MEKSKVKKQKRNRRKARVRAKISGSEMHPRLSVFKSNTMLYVQIINDDKGLTLASAKGGDANLVGQSIAQSAKSKGVNKIVFDRAGYSYTGKIKALAESIRSAGLEF